MAGSITYLSEPASVSMADEWFELATPDHFWMSRRFDVFAALMGDETFDGLRLGEIGCGHGAVLRQCRQRFNVDMDGFDLNPLALEQGERDDPSLQLYCYDIHDRRDELAGIYDGLVLFDVIEHIDDDAGFIESACFHLKPGGFLAIDVPGSMRLFSAYDEVAGHVRRYEPETLAKLAERTGLVIDRWTWWGRPLRPIARLRRHVVRQMARDRVIQRGFKPPGRLGNTLLRMLSNMERIPQQRGGCFLMAIMRRAPEESQA